MTNRSELESQAQLEDQPQRVDVGARTTDGVYAMTECVDLFGSILRLFDLAASTFFFGELCDKHEFSGSQPGGMLHVARNGRVQTRHDGNVTVLEPTSVVLYPRPVKHSYEVLAADGTEAVCANLVFRGGDNSPFVSCLPNVVTVSAEAGTPIAATADLMFAEARLGGAGVTASLDRLSEVMVIQLVRHQLETGESLSGVLAGLAMTDLAPAIVALHQNPERAWTVQTLADCAFMSRTGFATEFSRVVGTTPIQYMNQLRIYLAMGKLNSGLTVSDVADQLGFASQSAFSRVFRNTTGSSPTDWRRANQP